MRGAGSAAFVVGTLLSGQAVSAFGLNLIVGLQAPLLGAAALAALFVPDLRHHSPAIARSAPQGGVHLLLRLSLFRRLLLVAALILGSHAMHDAFAVIRWSAAGIGPATASVLWSESVAAEVLVFFVIGPTLMVRLTAAGAAALAALAGVLRWAVMAQTTAVIALRWCNHCTASPLRCCISPPCVSLLIPCRPASKGRRRRSTGSAVEPPPPCSSSSPALSMDAWARTGFGSWRCCVRWPSR